MLLLVDVEEFRLWQDNGLADMVLVLEGGVGLEVGGLERTAVLPDAIFAGGGALVDAVGVVAVLLLDFNFLQRHIVADDVQRVVSNDLELLHLPSDGCPVAQVVDHWRIAIGVDEHALVLVEAGHSLVGRVCVGRTDEKFYFVFEVPDRLAVEAGLSHHREVREHEDELRGAAAGERAVVLAWGESGRGLLIG